jgi:2Fe-2S ferredoxin
MTPTVRVEPAVIEFDILPHETVMAAALRHGYWWPTLCQGNAECTVCVMTVLQGQDLISDIDQREQETLDTIRPQRFKEGSPRLACQVKLTAADGCIVVQKRGVRPEWAKSRPTCATHSTSQIQSPQADNARILELCAAALRANQEQVVAKQSRQIYTPYMKFLTGCAKLFREGGIDVSQFTPAK